MNNHKLLLFIVSLILFTGTSHALQTEKRAILMFEKAVSSPSVPGLSVAIADRNGIVWSKGFGYSDLENMVPMTKETKLRIGSVAKVITTAALMRLYEQGKVNLDSDIRELVTEWPKKHKNITLNHLTSHTSGIRHYKHSHTADESLSNIKYKNTIDALNIFKNDPLKFTPGTEFSYSTYGWTLISAVMEKATGTKDFKAIIFDEVIAPLNLDNTTFDENDVVIKNRQRPYTYSHGKLYNSQEVDVSYKYAGGGFLSTPSDIVNFAIAHTKFSFLKEDTLNMMFKNTKLIDGSDNIFGIGWEVGFNRHIVKAMAHAKANVDQLRIMKEHPKSVMHSGGSVGGTTMMILCIEHEHSVTVVKNVGHEPTANVFSLALRTLDLFHKNI
jgi:serine beta-lactamase-like protein LACTB